MAESVLSLKCSPQLLTHPLLRTARSKAGPPLMASRGGAGESADMAGPPNGGAQPAAAQATPAARLESEFKVRQGVAGGRCATELCFHHHNV